MVWHGLLQTWVSWLNIEWGGMVYCGPRLAWFTVELGWHGLLWSWAGMVYCGLGLAWFKITQSVAWFVVGLDGMVHYKHHVA